MDRSPGGKAVRDARCDPDKGAARRPYLGMGSPMGSAKLTWG